MSTLLKMATQKCVWRSSAFLTVVIDHIVSNFLIKNLYIVLFDNSDLTARHAFLNKFWQRYWYFNTFSATLNRLRLIAMSSLNYQRSRIKIYSRLPHLSTWLVTNSSWHWQIFSTSWHTENSKPHSMTVEQGSPYFLLPRVLGSRKWEISESFWQFQLWH